MIGTISNVVAIAIGCIAGTLLHSGIKEKYKTILYDGLGLASLAIGLNATISNLSKSIYPVLFIIAISLGGVIGTAMDIDGKFKRLVNKISKGGNSKNLAEGLSTATLLYCIGPLSMLGPMISALKGDNTFLYTNATLDLISSIVFASTYGIGIILSAPILFCWQGLFYLIANVSSTAISQELIAEILIVGGLLIVASGLSLLKIRDCKTLNLLPSLLIPVIWFAIKKLLETMYN